VDPLWIELIQSRQIGRYEQVYSTHHHKAGMWPRSRRLGLEAVSRPIKASASVSSRTVGERLGLGIKGLALGIDLGHLDLVHIPATRPPSPPQATTPPTGKTLAH